MNQHIYPNHLYILSANDQIKQNFSKFLYQRGVAIITSILLLCTLFLSFVPDVVSAQSDTDRYPLNHANHGDKDRESDNESDRRLPAPPESSICTNVSNIPALECNTLVAFYKKTNGERWTDQTNWLVVEGNITPCSWYGVTCSDGHVTQLRLASNNLKGDFPAVLGNLTRLTHLFLNENRLDGKVDSLICQLQNSVTNGDLSHNQLSTRQGRVEKCLNAIDPDWEETQTRAPNRIRIGEVRKNAITLEWDSVRHRGDDGGYYQISYTTDTDTPYTVHGRTEDKDAESYHVDDLTSGQTYYFCVQAFTPEQRDDARNNDQREDTLSRCATATATTRVDDDEQVLLLVFFPADNDLSPYVDTIRQRLKRGTRYNPNVQVVMLADQLGDNNTTLYQIQRGRDQNITSAIQEQFGADELDTSDPEVLAWFLNYGRTQYPAARAMLIAGGHGVGLTPEVAWLPTDGSDESVITDLSQIPALPRGIEVTPGDVTDGSYMSTIDFGNALAAATDNGANPFDLIFFDQCFQGNLDVLYEVHQNAEIFIASPNYAWLSAPYDRYLPHFNPQTATADMADQIIRIYQEALNNQHPNAIFWVQGDQIPVIGNAVSQLATALQTAVQAGQDTPILNASLNSQFVDTTQCGLENLQLGPPDELLGAESFAQNLQSNFGANDAYGVHSAASQLLTTLADVRSTYRTGNPYIEPTTTWDYTNTFTLLAPLQRNLTADTVWRASIYREDVPLTATWAPAPTYTLSITTSFAFARDGQWDNFIGDWYTSDLEPTVGEWCHYIPSPIVTDEVTETLTLEGEASESGLTLEWTPSSDSAINSYWIRTRGPDDVSWRVEEVVIEETSYVVDGGSGGVGIQSIQPRQIVITLDNIDTTQNAYYEVVALDENGTVLAQSNRFEWVVEGSSTDTLTQDSAYEVYLPVVRR